MASLYVHRDSASLRSRITAFTDTLTKLSRDFTFDHQLWSTKVYKDASPDLIELMRKRIRQPEDIGGERVFPRLRSQPVDEQIKEDLRNLNCLWTILIQGSDRSLCYSFMAALEIAALEMKASEIIDITRRGWSPTCKETREAHRKHVLKAVAEVIDLTLRLMEREGLSIDDHATVLETPRQEPEKMTAEGAAALQAIWTDGRFLQAMLTRPGYAPWWAE